MLVQIDRDMEGEESFLLHRKYILTQVQHIYQRMMTRLVKERFGEWKDLVLSSKGKAQMEEIEEQVKHVVDSEDDPDIFLNRVQVSPLLRYKKRHKTPIPLITLGS